MMVNLLKKLEDPNEPFLGPNKNALKFWGLILPKNKFKKYFYLLMHFLVSVFTLTEWVDIFFLYDLNLLMNNVKITMLATMSVIKVNTFLYWQHNWKEIISYVTNADLKQRIATGIFKPKPQNSTREITTSKKFQQLPSKDLKILKEKIEIITKYTKYCRKITYFYWFLMYTTVVIVIFTPIFKFFLSESYRQNTRNGTIPYHQVVSSWVPFNKNTLAGHIGASIIQSYASVYGGGWITSFDTNAMVIMVFFKGELELLRKDTSQIFQEDDQSFGDLERLVDCKKRHNDLVKFARLFDSCLSPIMFFYMFVCSVMLCVTAYQITIETSAVQQFLTMEFLVFGVAQLFIYCWHSNDVLYASHSLMLGPYESTWWRTDPSKRKIIHILIEQFKKTIVFSAGPFNRLTVPTFINIIKGAYSYYTLLTQSQIK